MRVVVCALLMVACSSQSGSSFELNSGGFENEREPLLGGTIMAWNDRMTFNNGYQERAEPAFEAVASESIFDPAVDLLSLDGQSFLDAVHTFRFGDGMHLRINDSNNLREGEELQLNSDEGNARWQLAFKLGAESLSGSAELDDPRRGIRLPGRHTAKMVINSLTRDEAQIITAMEAELELKVERCPPSEHNRGEGEAYRPGAFKARLTFAPMGERLAEHNL